MTVNMILKTVLGNTTPSEALKGNFFHVLINNNDKKGNHSFSRCWRSADHTLHQDCSGVVGRGRDSESNVGSTNIKKVFGVSSEAEVLMEKGQG